MQLELMHESINDALGFLVQALGGAKKVGHQLRPELPADHAATWVRDCLNPGRRERFTPEQVLWLLRAGRRAGIHSAMDFIAADTGYTAAPIEPEDERDQLRRDYIATVKMQQQIAERLERLERVGVIRSVG